MKVLTLNERQQQCLKTCMDSCKGTAYPALALCEEVAELMQKIKNIVDWNDNCIHKNEIETKLNDFIKTGLELGMFAKKIRHNTIEEPFRLMDITRRDEEFDANITDTRLELGDVDWELNVLAWFTGYTTMQYVADINSMKLELRQKNNTIDGKGDHERVKLD